MNIYDIAREAGVSIATVSRVLNHKDTVRADTRAKVEKVLKRNKCEQNEVFLMTVNKAHEYFILKKEEKPS